MGLGQIQLVLASLVILSTLQLSIYSSILRSYITSWDSEATITAISIGQTMIDEIYTQAYDSVSVKKLVTKPSEFTPSWRLGSDKDSGEVKIILDQEPFQSQGIYNDVDDYIGYTRIVKTSHLGNFTVKDSVYYVKESDQNTYSASPTWFKKVIVTVTHPNLLSPMVVKSLVVYRRYLQ